MRLKTVIIILLLSSSFQLKAIANDTVLINQLVKDIASMQYADEGAYNFRKGMFYSYKKYAGYPERITPDNNIFFTALAAFALKNMLPYLSDENKKLTERIIANAAWAYPYYQNKRKQPTYFFWPLGQKIMPNTYLIQHLTKPLGTSEDTDDTIMILMAMDASARSIQQVKLIMDSAANGNRRLIKNTFKRYKRLPAHSTWLGSKMRIDYDFGVHCNVIYFLLQNKVPFNQYDSATVKVLQQMIHNREYIKHPHFISPYYLTPAILLYHISRLMGKFTIPAIEPYRQQIIDDIYKQIQKSRNMMDDIILRTSLLRLGAEAPAFSIDSIEDFNNSNEDEFVFYQARGASQFDNPFKRLFINFSMLNYHFFCPAYNKVLLLEYLVERNKAKQLLP